jgi:hypothetical protein
VSRCHRQLKVSSNSSDIEGGVLQRNNIRIAVCGEDEVQTTLAVLKASPSTNKGKVKFILATSPILSRL